MEPLSWTVIATLVAEYGLPFVEQLITNIATKEPVNPETWNSLLTKINTPFDVLVPKKS